MIKADISKNNPQQNIQASGNLPELVSDLALLVNGLYTQFRNADPNTAALFRTCVENMIKDPNGPAWGNPGNQTGIIFRKPR